MTVLNQEQATREKEIQKLQEIISLHLQTQATDFLQSNQIEFQSILKQSLQHFQSLKTIFDDQVQDCLKRMEQRDQSDRVNRELESSNALNAWSESFENV